MQTTNVNRRTEQYDVAFAMKPWQIGVKRCIDILGGLAGLVLSSPVLILVSIALKIQGDGPLFYSQERIGKGGKPFFIHKFRTMCVGAEKADEPILAEPNDDRLTKVGAFLRKHHLDELPQFWNVVKGDMSLVGYRPERKFFIDQIMEVDSRYRCLFQIRPGVTSEATIYNGYTNTMDQMLERLNMDLRYLETASVRKDLVILCKTFIAML